MSGWLVVMPPYLYYFRVSLLRCLVISYTSYFTGITASRVAERVLNRFCFYCDTLPPILFLIEK